MLSQKHSACILTAVLLLASASGCSVKTDNTASADPLTITVWTYYNGDQLELFNKLVSEFNDTTGRSLGITVESSSQGTVNDLETNVLASANGEVGASDMPNIFSAYADTAYTLDQMGLVMDLSDYLTKEERLAYIDNYLDEGDFSGDGSIKIFPVAKSTELLFYGEGSQQMAEIAFERKPDGDTFCLKGVVSRKKQLIPAMMEAAQLMNSDYA